MTELCNKVARVHGDNHPELAQVVQIFNIIAQSLHLQLMKEEQILFPYIKELLVSRKQNRTIERANFGKINNQTQKMETEHQQVGEGMKAIRDLTEDYQLPHDACSSYQILFKKLQEFESDLFNHVHLKNNILFPKAIALEVVLVG